MSINNYDSIFNNFIINTFDFINKNVFFSEKILENQFSKFLEEIDSVNVKNDLQKIKLFLEKNFNKEIYIKNIPELEILHEKDFIFISQPFGKQSSIDYFVIIEGVLFLIEVKTSKNYNIMLNNHIPNINVLYLISFKNDSFLDLNNIYLINGNSFLNKKEYDYLKIIFKQEDHIEKLKKKTKEELISMIEEIKRELLTINNKTIRNIILKEKKHIEGILLLQNNKYNIKPYNRKNFQINSKNILKFNKSIFDIIKKINK